MKKVVMVGVGILLLIVLALGALYLNRASLIQQGVQKQIESLTGTAVEVSIPDVQKGLNQITISSLKIMNPSGYKQPVLAELQDLELTCDWIAGLMHQVVKCEKVHATLAAVYLERHQPQGFNLKDLKVFSGGVSQGGVQVSRYELDFGRAEIDEYVDAQSEAQKTEVDLGNRVEVYSQISDPAVLIYAPVLRIIPEFKRGNMGIPRSVLQQKISKPAA